MTGYPSIDKPWLKYYSKNAIDTPLLDGTIYECLKEKSTEYENLCAINYYGNRITYKQLLINIDKVASYFVSIGIKQGDCVTFCMLNTPEMVYCAYALSKIGAIADFEYPTLAVEEMKRSMINNSSDTLVILSLFYDKYESVCKSIKNVIVVNPEDSMSFINRTAFKVIKRQRTGKEFSLSIKNIKNLEEVKNCNSDGNKPVIMVHTGGTTGVPKGVLLSSNNLNFIACDYSVCGMEYRKGDSILHGIPPFHAYGFSIGIHMPLMLGFTIYMQIKVDDDSIANSFFKCKPTHVVGSASHIYSIAVHNDKKRMDLSSMGIIAVGGSSLNEKQKEIVEKFLLKKNACAKVVTGYGMSELSATACTERNDCRKEGTVGIPLPHVTAKIVDECGQELPYDKIGELYISSPGIMIGYKDVVNENSIKIIDDDGNIWIKTGDMASIDEDGFVSLAGRIKNIFTTRYNGILYKVFPEYVNSVLLKMEGIEDAVTISLSDSKRINMPISYVVVSQTLTQEDVISHCKTILPEHSMPCKIVFLSKIPKNALGKIDYKELEKNTDL